MSRPNILDDELRVKRVFIKVENGSKSTYNFKEKNKHLYYKDSRSGQYINKNMFRKNTEVVVKITSGSKNFQSLSKHIDYISRNGTLELITNDFLTYKGNQENYILKKYFKNNGASIPEFAGIEKRERRHTINMVFSMKDHSTTPSDKLKQATITALKRMYPDNFFVVAFHNDTDNPHCHICLKVAKDDGKRINPRKTDLANLRVEFAKALNELGIEAKATIRKQNLEQEQQKEVKQDKNLSKGTIAPKPKMHYYQVVDFGSANYKFSTDKNAPKSFYVKYRTKNNITTIWSKDLERVVKENKVLRGEYARFKIVGQEPYEIKRKAKINGKWQEVVKIERKSTWDVSVFGREKDLKEVKNSSKIPKYSIAQDKELLKQGEQNNERTYPKQYKQRVLSELSYKKSKRRGVATQREPVRILSQKPMVYDTKRTQVLLHINELNQLQQRERGRSSNIVRWTNTRNNRDVGE